MVVENHLCLDAFPLVETCGFGRCSPDQQRKWWRLPELWSLHCYDYHAKLQVGSDHLTVAPGMVSLVAPETFMSYVWTEPVRHPFALFKMPTENTAAQQRIPVLQKQPAGFTTHISEAALWWPHQPQRVATRLLDLLWQLSQRDSNDTNPLLDRAAHIITEHLDDPLPITELARLCGVAHNTLTRHVNRHLGISVVAWVRQRRAEHARNAMIMGASASEAAAGIGIHNAQRFNKLFRQVFGYAPTKYKQPPPDQAG